MAFADIPERNEFQKASYVSIKPGKPVLFQLLGEKAERFDIHTVRTSDGRYPKIVHDSKMGMLSESPFTDQYKVRTIYRANVLNVTPVVVNPVNGNIFPAVNGRMGVPERDPADGTDLSKIQARPLNEVQILERGKVLFAQINSQIDMMMNTKENFDHREIVFQIQATGQGRQMQTVVFYRPDIVPITGEALNTYELLDLSLPVYSEEEIRKMIGGVALKDIYEARRNQSDAPFTPDNKLDFSKGLPGLF